MEIFHYVADQLKNTSLFESSVAEPTDSPTGAIYNDFDSACPFGDSGGSTLEPTQTTASASTLLVTQEDMDYALTEADEESNLFDEYTHFESENFDVSSLTADDSYHEKVKNNFRFNTHREHSLYILLKL